ncbi:MAG: hypothetical protein KDE08_13140 [Rhodobacteraceae bacterium]|nr:hypothetical protein [Paracoccaceae bacterium]
MAGNPGRSVAFIVSAWLLLATAAASCTRPSPSGDLLAIPSTGGLDQRRIDAAIRAEVNYARCRKGLAPLEASVAMMQVASGHAKWMARSRQLTHASTVAGRASTRARIRATGIPFRAGSENIGLVARYRIDGRSFRIRDAKTCQFADGSGQTIPAHSYASLASYVVELWMNSRSHRKNILDGRVRWMGSGAALDPRGPHCGSYYLAQIFAG